MDFRHGDPTDSSGMETVVTGLSRDIKQCRNEDTFYCNATVAVSAVAEKNPSATSLESHSRHSVK